MAYERGLVELTTTVVTVTATLAVCQSTAREAAPLWCPWARAGGRKDDMAYLDLSNGNAFKALLARYWDAHPQALEAERAAAARAPTGKRRRPIPGPFTQPLSPATVRRIMQWGREHFLLRRKDAERFAERYALYHSDPRVVIPMTRALCGTPPRQQQAVRLAALLHWVFMTERPVTGGDELLPLPAARTVLRGVAKDPEVHQYPRERAAWLVGWLKEQEQGQDTPEPQLVLFETHERSA
jgi:hypothetical protein